MSNLTAEDGPKTIDHDLWTVEFSQAMEMYRSISSWTIQSLTVLVVANVTLLGFAFERKSAGIMFLTGFLPVLAFYVIHRYMRGLVPVMYMVLNLEKWRNPHVDLFATSLLGMDLSDSSIKKLLDIADEEDFGKRMDRLAKLHVDHDRRPTRGFSRGISIVAAILQFAGAIVLNWYFNWSWFS